jgi:hypothetical protein
MLSGPRCAPPAVVHALPAFTSAPRPSLVLPHPWSCSQLSFVHPKQLCGCCHYRLAYARPPALPLMVLLLMVLLCSCFSRCSRYRLACVCPLAAYAAAAALELCIPLPLLPSRIRAPSLSLALWFVCGLGAPWCSSSVLLCSLDLRLQPHVCALSLAPWFVCARLRPPLFCL